MVADLRGLRRPSDNQNMGVAVRGAPRAAVLGRGRGIQGRLLGNRSLFKMKCC